MVTDAQARAALAVWNGTPGTDLVAMRAVLESFESAEIARLEYAQKDAAEVTALFASVTEGSDMTTELRHAAIPLMARDPLYETAQGERTEFQKGQDQRVAEAKALLHAPKDSLGRIVPGIEAAEHQRRMREQG